MKKKIITLITILAVAPLLLQCASQQEVQSLRYQLRVVNKKLEDMKEETVGEMQQRQAASSSQIDELRQETLTLQGKLDEMAHFNRQLREQNKELELSLQQSNSTLKEQIQKERDDFVSRDKQKSERLVELEEKLMLQQRLLQNIQEARIREAKRNAEIAARKAAEARERAKASNSALASRSSNRIVEITADKKKVKVNSQEVQQTTTQNSQKTTAVKQATTPATTTSTTTGDLYAAADKAYTGGDYQKASKLFQDYINNNKSGEQTISAEFMIGECLYQQGEYDQAILQYQKIISNHPKHRRASSALLKQGMSFEKLSDFETAKIIYKKIATSYPSAPEAATAKERSAALK